jgi:hypothetical protein
VEKDRAIIKPAYKLKASTCTSFPFRPEARTPSVSLMQAANPETPIVAMEMEAMEEGKGGRKNLAFVLQFEPRDNRRSALYDCAWEATSHRSRDLEILKDGRVLRMELFDSFTKTHLHPHSCLAIGIRTYADRPRGLVLF